jgi:hypothetical protein
MTAVDMYSGESCRLKLERIQAAPYFTRLNLNAFLLVLLLAVMPGTASALSVEFFNIDKPEVIIPLVLLIEIPFAIWISGFMGAEDRRTIKATFSTILSHDFSGMDADEIMATIFWGENSITVFIFRIWLAVVAAMLCALTFSQIEPALQLKFDIPAVGVMIISFSLFSYIFIRNMCEETVRDQIGHAFLSATFSGVVFAGFHYMA